jgi:hypothetical protein
MQGDVIVGSNPTSGKAVTMSPFSGPKGSPFDAKKYPANIYQPKLTDLVVDPTNYSTGALSTGIGFAPTTRSPGMGGVYDRTIPASVNFFSDDAMPGVTMPNGTAAPDARLLAIGGGRSTANTVAAPSVPQPYNALPILNFGNGGSRDAGAGPIFVGFGMKLVTAVGTVAQGAAIESGFVNRQEVPITVGNSQFGSSNTSSPVIA